MTKIPGTQESPRTYLAEGGDRLEELSETFPDFTIQTVPLLPGPLKRVIYTVSAGCWYNNAPRALTHKCIVNPEGYPHLPAKPIARLLCACQGSLPSHFLLEPQESSSLIQGSSPTKIALRKGRGATLNMSFSLNGFPRVP